MNNRSFSSISTKNGIDSYAVEKSNYPKPGNSFREGENEGIWEAIA